jgi:hypothetical protein
MKIKLVARLLWIWDVTFTCIDEWQLRKYLKLREYLGKLETDYIQKGIIKLNIEPNDLEEYENWVDVQ